MNDPWTLRGGERVIFTMPRAAVVRSFLMNHIIHHRADPRRLPPPQRHPRARHVWAKW